jgi:hypothetical protein
VAAAPCSFLGALENRVIAEFFGRTDLSTAACYFAWSMRSPSAAGTHAAAGTGEWMPDELRNTLRGLQLSTVREGALNE